MPRRHRLRALRQEVDQRSRRRRILTWAILALLLGISVLLSIHAVC